MHKEEVRIQVSRMRDRDLIRPSYSPGSSPVWVVAKKQEDSLKQKWSIVVDYRKRNQFTTNKKYPLPNISDFLSQLFLSRVSIHIAIDHEEIQKTALPGYHWEWPLRICPDALLLKECIFLGTQNEGFLAYMDEIIIYSPTIHDRLAHLTMSFNVLSTSP